MAVANPPGKWITAESGKYKYQFVEQDLLKTRFYTLGNGLKVILSVNKKGPRIQGDVKKLTMVELFGY